MNAACKHEPKASLYRLEGTKAERKAKESGAPLFRWGTELAEKRGARNEQPERSKRSGECEALEEATRPLGRVG